MREPGFAPTRLAPSRDPPVACATESQILLE
jgi:hypothetical protein